MGPKDLSSRGVWGHVPLEKIGNGHARKCIFRALWLGKLSPVKVDGNLSAGAGKV